MWAFVKSYFQFSALHLHLQEMEVMTNGVELPLEKENRNILTGGRQVTLGWGVESIRTMEKCSVQEEDNMLLIFA